MVVSNMAAFDLSGFFDFEQVKNFSSYFADFEQVKTFSSQFADFELRQQVYEFFGYYPRSIQIPKTPICEIAPPGTLDDVRCKRLRFENGPYYAWSVLRDVGQVLHRQTNVPVKQLRCTSDQGAGS